MRLGPQIKDKANLLSLIRDRNRHGQGGPVKTEAAAGLSVHAQAKKPRLPATAGG